MNSLLILLMIRAFAAGPLADYYWLVSTEGIIEMIESGEPPIIGSSGLRTRYSIAQGRKRFVLNAGYSGNAWMAGYNFQVKVERMDDRQKPGISGALELGVGSWRLSLGPVRGGMGAGLMVGERMWNSSGAGVKSAWTGIPTRLRVGPASEGYPRPQAVSLNLAGRPWVTLSLIRTEAGIDFLLAELRPSGVARAVLLHSEDRNGFEVSIGSRGDVVEWRVSGAVWNAAQEGDGGSAELLVSSRGSEANWGLRLWSWQGGKPPLAPPPRGAAASRRFGGSMSIEMKPLDNVRLAASLESAFNSGRNPESFWWRSQFELFCGRAASAGLQLRLKKTDELEAMPWHDWSSSSQLLVEMKVRSAVGRRIRWYGGFRMQGEGPDSSSGFWVKADSVDRKWTRYVRATFSRPSIDLPLYWYEPGPAYGWNLRFETIRGIRLLFGLHNREGFHVQLIAQSNRLSGLKASWFHKLN